MADPLHVLILEDNEDDAFLITHELKRADFNFDWTRVDTEEAFEEELKNTPDLILADFSLPQYNALEALSLLKKTGLDIPFIIISGAITEETAIRCIKEGATDYLLKDRLARLGSAVQQAMDEYRLRQEKHFAEQALSESEAKYRSLFFESREGIFTTTLDGIITETNPAFDELIGYSREAIIGKPLAELFADQSMYKRLLEFSEYGFARNVEVDLKHKDGNILHVLFTGSAMKGQKGEPQSFMGIARDITERKRGQREMEVIVTVNAALRTAPNRKMMVPVIADIIQGISQAEGVAVVLNDPVTGKRQVEAITGKWSDYSAPDILLDEDVLAKIMEKGTPKRWDDPFNRSELHIQMPDEAFKSLACIPMTTTTAQVGLIWYGCSDRCSDEAYRLAQVVSNISANAIHRTTLHENNVRSLQESEAMATISRILNQNLNLETIFEQIVREAVDIIPEAFRSVIHLFDEKNERLHAVALGWSHDSGIDTKSLINIRVSPKNEFDFGMLAEEDIQAASMRVGRGVAGIVIESGETVMVRDTNNDPRYLPTNSGTPIRSILVSPIMSGELRMGTLSVLGKDVGVFTPADQNLVGRLCTQASIAIENARLLEAERQQRNLAQAQAEISALLNQSLEMNEVLAGILNHTIRFFKATAANIMLIVDDRLEVVRQLGYGQDEEYVAKFSVGLTELKESYPLLDEAYQTGENVQVPDTQTNPLWVKNEKIDWIRSYVCVPLIVNERVVGLLNLDSNQANAFEGLEIQQLKSFADSAAAAVENARLYTDLEQAL
ncbi:MAG TPA: GAF domain-containing protein, partial [Anaerolineales bacterium]|nr:GAF domain-containing protein [Anaerolineales bacterium]